MKGLSVTSFIWFGFSFLSLYPTVYALVSYHIA